jgi:hypothetical protein
MAKTINWWLPTAKALVQSKDMSGICDVLSGTGACFLRVLRFPFKILVPATAPHSLSILQSTLNSLGTDSVGKWVAQETLTRRLKGAVRRFVPEFNWGERLAGRRKGEHTDNHKRSEPAHEYSFMPQPLYPKGKNPQCSLDRSLVGSRSRYWCCGRENYGCLWQESNLHSSVNLLP